MNIRHTVRRALRMSLRRERLMQGLPPRWLPRGGGRRALLAGVPMLLVLLLASPGCVSPLDPDTPRRRIVDVPDVPAPPRRVEARITDIIVFESGLRWQFNADTRVAEASVDTTEARPRVWTRLVLTRGESQVQNVEHLFGLLLRLDSIATPQEQLLVRGNPHRGTGVALIIAAPVTTGVWRYDTLETVTTGAPGMVMTLMPDSSGRVVSCVGHFAIPQRRISLELSYRVQY